MYVYNYICMYVCMHAWMYACMYVCMYIYVHIHIFRYTYIFIYIYTYMLCFMPGIFFEIWGSRAILMRCLFKFDGIHASIEWDFGGIDYWILRGF
jgi:hypothetical protein